MAEAAWRLIAKQPVSRALNDRLPAQTAPDAGAHWRSFATQWGLLGSPLRPCADDIRIVERLLVDEPAVFRAREKKRVWLLGVTPEIAAARWPHGVELVAVERVQAMIDGLWPGDTDWRQAICADWLHAPFPNQSFDLVIGDGCLTHVAFPDGLSRLLVSAHRCLRRDGYLMLRLFCRPDVAETPEVVISALRAGEIRSIHAFKWRLLMSLQGITDAPDVAVDDAWRVWSAARIEPDTLAEKHGWSPEQVGTIEFYRGSPARYNFMRFDATMGYLQRAGFDLVAMRIGNYELGERCPHVLLRKKQGRLADSVQ